MDIRQELNEKLKENLKSGDKVAMATIRLMMAALKDRDLTAKGQGRAEGVEDTEILSMFQSMIKQRQESSKTYRAAEREDLADREDAEIKVIERFLPKQLDEEEVKLIIKRVIRDIEAAGMKDMGKIMGVLKADYAGQIDMGKASSLVKSQLDS